MSDENKHNKTIAETPVVNAEKLEEKEYTILRMGFSRTF
jgi:hypothetical protein